MLTLLKRRRKPKTLPERIELGWCEYASLPDLGLPPLRAKIDTGARTSSLHATRIERFEREDHPWVRFTVRASGLPLSRVEAPLVEKRRVTSSNGIDQHRFVIRTMLCLGGRCRPVEITLANRASMAFPMLVGRTALKRGYVVNVARRYALGGGAGGAVPLVSRR